ncbi:MAG: hypothetical protein JW816_02470 [Candidatus Buchananbacteria bacterium]|nr:hypothetical protein [Candidatus Buchananbacteria bacterium]
MKSYRFLLLIGIIIAVATMAMSQSTPLPPESDFDFTVVVRDGTNKGTKVRIIRGSDTEPTIITDNATGDIVVMTPYFTRWDLNDVAKHGIFLYPPPRKTHPEKPGTDPKWANIIEVIKSLDSADGLTSASRLLPLFDRSNDPKVVLLRLINAYDFRLSAEVFDVILASPLCDGETLHEILRVHGKTVNEYGAWIAGNKAEAEIFADPRIRLQDILKYGLWPGNLLQWGAILEIYRRGDPGLLEAAINVMAGFQGDGIPYIAYDLLRSSQLPSQIARKALTIKPADIEHADYQAAHIRDAIKNGIGLEQFEPTPTPAVTTIE